MCSKGIPAADLTPDDYTPEYYADSDGQETIDIIRVVTKDLHGEAAFDIGNVVKYVLRAGKKPGNAAESDLAKAANYAYRAVYGHWRGQTCK